MCSEFHPPCSVSWQLVSFLLKIVSFLFNVEVHCLEDKEYSWPHFSCCLLLLLPVFVFDVLVTIVLLKESMPLKELVE